MLLRSWIAEAGLADSAAWVQVQHQGSDPQRIWMSVIERKRGAEGADARTGMHLRL